MAIASILLALAFALIGCGGPDIKADELGALPEASLLPDGATVLRSGGVDGQVGIDHDVPSKFETVAGVGQSVAELDEFYTDALADAGWVPVGDSQSQDDLTILRWAKGDYDIHVYVRNEDYRARVDPAWSNYVNLIELTLYGYDHATPVPS